MSYFSKLFIENCNEDSADRFVFEVDIQYCDRLYERCIYLFLLPKNKGN